ncbi:hypothetical protein C5167_035329, partial [Papaver somniferum]
VVVDDARELNACLEVAACMGELFMSRTHPEREAILIKTVCNFCLFRAIMLPLLVKSTLKRW